MNTNTYSNKNFPGLMASENAWRAVGFHIVGNPKDWPGDEAKYSRHDMPYEVVHLAIGIHGPTDAALYWAAQEIQRRREETTRACAISREAESLRELAGAIRGSSESALLEKILGRVTEKTRFAIQQQLRGTGVAGR